jgi:hypothetical protein
MAPRLAVCLVALAALAAATTPIEDEGSILKDGITAQFGQKTPQLDEGIIPDSQVKGTTVSEDSAYDHHDGDLGASVADKQKVNWQQLAEIHTDAAKALAGDRDALSKLQNIDCSVDAYEEGQQQCCKRTSTGCACLSEADGSCRPKCADHLPEVACPIADTGGR